MAWRENVAVINCSSQLWFLHALRTAGGRSTLMAGWIVLFLAGLF